MDAQDLIPHRAALVGAALALAAGITGGLILKTGPQTAPEDYSEIASSLPETQAAEPIGWTGRGAPPDYVVGSDFLAPHDAEPPVVAAAYEVEEYKPAPPPEAAPPLVQPARVVQSETPAWPSTHGDILDTRLPEDPPQAPSAREALAAVTAPVAMAAAAY